MALLGLVQGWVLADGDEDVLCDRVIGVDAQYL
eukprot:COSAG01_NODE_1860_length_9040_cov_20.109607_6_plen_33_part_00